LVFHFIAEGPVTASDWESFVAEPIIPPSVIDVPVTNVTEGLRVTVIVASTPMIELLELTCALFQYISDGADLLDVE
jgi:hypothetical protein